MGLDVDVSSPAESGDRRVVDGLEKLRDSLRLILIGWGLVFIAVIVMVVAVGAVGLDLLMRGDMSEREIERFMEELGPVVMLVMAVVFLLFLGSFAVWFLGVSRLRGAMDLLASVFSDVGIGSSGARLMFYGIIMMIIGGLTLIIVVGAFILLIGSIVFLIGQILFIAGMLNLDNHIESDVRTPSILFLAGMVVSFVGMLSNSPLALVGFVLEIVGLVMLYQAVSRELDTARSKYMAPYRPPPQERGFGI